MDSSCKDIKKSVWGFRTMNKKNRFLIKQGIKYLVIFGIVIGAIIFYSLITSMPKEHKIISLAIIIGISLFMLILDLISFKDIWGIFGK